MKTNAYRIVKNGNDVYSIQRSEPGAFGSFYWRTIVFNLDHLQQAMNKLDNLEREAKQVVVHARTF